MKKIYYSIALMAFAALPISAQETYENTKLIDNDLNGTARYVGMGGAMEALGADLSTMSTNPAGIGLFRKSKAETSFGLVNQQDASKFSSLSKTNASFDQAGFVYSLRNGRNSFLNFGFNYHKSRNFDQILNASGSLSNASQNKLTYQKFYQNVITQPTDMTYSQVDNLYYNNLIYNSTDKAYYNYPATDYRFNQQSKGYIGEYDFNISGNIQDRIYLGLTFGIHDVHYKGYSEYSENYATNNANIDGSTLADNREITGTGYDVKVGAIFRPIESSPFRIGLYINTPTWYDLTTSNSTTLTVGKNRGSIGESYDFKLYTPWKFGVSLGHTIDNFIALGATYEYADYGSMDTRVNDGGYYNPMYDSYSETSSSDKDMNTHTENTLKGVHTFKVGAEVKITPQLAVRVGYNYLSAMYDKNGSMNGSISSPGSYYASQTSYVNWKDTNRFTCGLGYTIDKFNIDLAYQYSAQNGDFYPFMNYYENSAPSVEDNVASATKVSNKHSQLQLTVGYRF